MDLEFTVNNQTLKRKDSNQVVTSSSEYLGLVFDFETDDWENVSKYAFFRTGHINYPFELTEDKVIVPAYFLNDKYLLFGLFGVGDGDIRITTNVLRLHLENSYYDSETVDVRNFLEVEVDRLDGRIDGKVDIIEGKMLSTNDFTDYYKNFLDGFDGNIEAFLEDHKEEIEDMLIGEALRSKADKVHKHTESDITDLKDYALVSDVPTKTSDLVNDVPFLTQHQDITGKADKTYVDTELNKKSDKSYVDTELDKKSDKTYVDTELDKKADTGHKHTESDITDLQDYALEDDVYTKTEVDNLIYNLNNKMNVNSDKTIIQTGETSNITVQVKENGFPAINKTVNIYVED